MQTMNKKWNNFDNHLSNVHMSESNVMMTSLISFNMNILDLYRDKLRKQFVFDNNNFLWAFHKEAIAMQEDKNCPTNLTACNVTCILNFLSYFLYIQVQNLHYE